MAFNFDEIIDRTNTNSMKYDFTRERGKPDGILPLWVADMDFRTPPIVVEALKKSSEHGIFGYTDVKQAYPDAVKNWFSSRFSWDIEPEWLVKVPGVIYAVATAIRGLTEPGDAILIQQPVYSPFGNKIRVNQRKLVNSAVVCRDGVYHIDFDDFERKIREEQVKMFILCNPHNPVGRVWTQDELERLGDICLAYGVIMVSDEIHADFIYPRSRHRVLADLKPGYRDYAIICTSPSKTFNLAGLQIANIFIANPDLRRAFRQEMERSGYGQVNTMGLIACQAAYTGGQAWLDELLVYLQGNLDLLRLAVTTRLPGIRLIEPQGTYLAWLDCRELGLSPADLDSLLVSKAGIWLSEGTQFGQEGAGFQRINIACPRCVLKQALDQLQRALMSDIR